MVILYKVVILKLVQKVHENRRKQKNPAGDEAGQLLRQHVLAVVGVEADDGDAGVEERHETQDVL